FVNSLNGRYITAEDMGTSVEDMEIVLQETPFVTGVSKSHGGSGDPSPFTALGTVQGIKACVEEVFGSTSLEGKKIDNLPYMQKKAKNIEVFLFPQFDEI
ncbi:unnamed protein product, partial [marine sediment metagenome]